MKVQEVLDRVSALRPAGADTSILLARLLSLENMIRTEIQFTDPIPALDREYELCAQSPYDEVYEQYLTAQIDLTDMEVEQYNQDMQLFNGTYSEYAARFRRDNRPEAGKQVTGYD